MKSLKVLTAALCAAALVGCTSNPASSAAADKKITVGATLVPHAEILKNVVAGKLAADGYTLEVVEFSDYVQPNTALEEGELDANYFQTLGYMNTFNTENNYHLAAAVGVHIEPMGIYSKKITSLDELQDKASISIPNDSDNGDRALRFLIAKGLLNDVDKEGALNETDFNNEPSANPHNFEIVPLEAASLPLNLADVDVAVINGNYALEAKLPETNPALVIEVFDEETTVARTNYLVVKEDNLGSEKTAALIKAITSKEVQDYIDATYKGSVITSFIDTEGNPVK